MAEALPEPWLRGPLAGIDPLLAPTLHAFMQVTEDLEKHTDGLTDEEIWIRPLGLAPLGFHLRHMAGSVDRLTTYLDDRELTEEQMWFLRSEMTPGAGRLELLDGIFRALDRSSAVVQSLDVANLREPRIVGRKRLPTTVIGLTIHLAEHTERHCGQSIVLCKLLHALRAANGLTLILPQ